MIGFLSKKKGIGCSREYGKLCIDCTECENEPDLGSDACVRCVVPFVMDKGDAERIVLRNGCDREYHGIAAETVCRLADICVAAESLRTPDAKRICRTCPANPSAANGSIMKMIPDMNIGIIRSAMNAYEPSGKQCEECMVRTYRCLEEIEYMMNLLRKDAAANAYGIAEVR